MKIKIFLLFVSLFPFCQPCFSQTWNYNFGDSIYYKIPYDPYILNTQIKSLYSVKNKLYINGYFNQAGNKVCHRLATWSNYNWTPIAIHMWGGFVYDMEYYRNNLFIVGNFQNVDSIFGLNKKAKWNGLNWDFISDYSQDSIMDIWTILWKDNNMLIGGGFGYLNGNYFSNVALLDSTGTWNSMDGGMQNGWGVYCSIVYNNEIFLGGNFTKLSQHSIYGVARWDGQHWNSVGTGLYGDVWDLIEDTISHNLYAGGYITIPGTNVAGGAVARWDGVQWSYVADSSDSNVLKICFYRGKLYACGTFSNFDNKPITNLAQLNNDGWQQLYSSIVGGIQTITVFNDELILGGNFSYLNGNRAYGLARYYEPPDSACLYFNPAIYTDKDTFYLTTDTGKVQFYSNSMHGSTWLWNFADSFTDTARLPKHTYTDTGTYTVSLTLTEAHCTKTITKNIVILDSVTAIEEQHKTNVGLKIFPNPANNNITIETVLQTNQTGQLKITDSRGKQLKTLSIKAGKSNTNVNTELWTKGIYFCSLIINGKEVKSEKLILK